VVGGGVAGLGTALGLARAGVDVTVFERDPLVGAADPDAASGWERRGAPQVRHTHGLLARLTDTLRQRYPDVLDLLTGAGGVEVDLAGRFGGDEPGDDRLRVLLARRTTLEWALRTAAGAEPRIRLRGGCPVASLTGEGRDVRGVVLESGERVDASSVVAAGGPRDGLVRWLAELGVDIPSEERPTGIVYLTRWYRTTDAWDRVMGGEDLVRLGGDLGYLFYLAVPADLGTFSLTMAIGSSDAALRARLMSPASFDRAAAAIPLPPGLLDRLQPHGGVHPMGGLLNRIRRFTNPDGRPLVTGLLAAGDCHTCTNPIYGRGCSLALVQAAALTDAMTAHPDDPEARAIFYEEACRRETEPWYRLSVQSDRARTNRARAEEAGQTDSERTPIQQLLEIGSDDPVVGRAVLRAVNLLATPQQLMSDPVLVGRVMELVAADASRHRKATSAWARRGPSHQEMLDLTAA
jgi:2-polyprenyl-6-methoxyphenol hydroxylase-like FAD-dependent oxidoreductase